MGAEWKYNWIILRATRGQFQVNRFQVVLCLKTSSDQNFVPMATWDKNYRSQPSIPLATECYYPV